MSDTAYESTKSGWWAETPYDTVWQRSGSNDSRLILPFNPAEELCFTCGSGSQMDPALPAQLAARGVTQEEWGGVMAELLAVQRRALGMCVGVAMVLTCILAPLAFCNSSGYQTHLRLWLERLNSAQLQPRGMLAKLQTVTTAGFRSSVTTRWLAIALTPDECAQLAAEPLFWAPQGGGISGRVLRWAPDSAATGCCRAESAIL